MSKERNDCWGRFRRPVAFVAVGLGVIAVFAVLLDVFYTEQPNGMQGGLLFGGSVALTTHKGTPFSRKELEGRVHIVFFGFTHCPDICPTALAELSHILERLGEKASQVRVLFVTVDPERDTPDQLNAYLSSFNNRYIIGVTGPSEAISVVAKQYRVFFEKVPGKLPDSYTMNHTARTYLFDRTGRLAQIFGYEDLEEKKITKIKKLIE